MTSAVGTLQRKEPPSGSSIIVVLLFLFLFHLNPKFLADLYLKLTLRAGRRQSHEGLAWLRKVPGSPGTRLHHKSSKVNAFGSALQPVDSCDQLVLGDKHGDVANSATDRYCDCEKLVCRPELQQLILRLHRQAASTERLDLELAALVLPTTSCQQKIRYKFIRAPTSPGLS